MFIELYRAAMAKAMGSIAKMSRVAVFKKLNAERKYQQSRWNPASNDASTREYGVIATRMTELGQETVLERYHELGAWISFMETYLEEARNINSKSDDKDAALLKILAVGALAVACLEQHGCPERPVPKTTKVPDKPVHGGYPTSPAYHGEQADCGRQADFVKELIPDCGCQDCPVHRPG